MRFSKLIGTILVFALLATTAVAGQVYFDPVTGKMSSLPATGKFKSAVIGTPLAQTGVGYTVWEVMDTNGDVVASCVVECSVITDGAQNCVINYYLMHDTPGTPTLESTIGTP